MAVILADHKLAYISVPKCACTSLKRYFHEVKTGERVASGKSGPRVHKLYPSEAFADLDHLALEGCMKVAAVRDPVARFMSGYHNKIVKEKCLFKHRRTLLEKVLRINPEPTIEEFVDRIALYRKASRIVQRHFQPLVHYLGDSPDWFDGLYPLSRLEDLRALVMARTGCDPPLAHANKSGRDLAQPEPSPYVKAKIEKLFTQDFEVFGDYF